MHHSSMPHQARFVVRIAGLPVSCLQRLTFRRTAPVLARMLTRDAHLQDTTAHLSDALHTQVAHAPDGATRRVLLGLRRALFNRQHAKVQHACAQLQHVLPAPLAAALTDWQAQVRAWDEDMAQGEELVAADWHEQRSHLRHMLQDTTLQQGLLLASPELTDDLRSWLRADPSTAPGRKLELSMLLYLTRMAAKTSPYSTFTGVAAGRWHTADGPAVRQSADMWSRQSLVEANRWVVNQIIGAVLAWPEVRPAASVLRNTSLHTSDATLHVLVWKRGETVVRMRATPAITHLLDRCVGPQPPTYQELVADLTAQVEDDQRERVTAFLEQVIDSGLLSLTIPVAEQHPRYIAACADWLEHCAGAPSARAIAHALHTLDAALHTYQATESVAERATVLAAIRATLQTISAECAARGTPISLPDKNILYEESLIADVQVEWSLPRWQHVLADLHQMQQLLRLFDPFLLAQMQIAETFVAQFGRGAMVPLLTAYAALRDSGSATHWQGGGMDAAVRLLSAAPGMNAPIVQQLQQRLVAWLAEQPAHTRTIGLDRTWPATRPCLWP